MQDWKKCLAIMAWYARRLGVFGVLGIVLGFSVLVSYYFFLKPMRLSQNIQAIKYEDTSPDNVAQNDLLPHISKAPTEIGTLFDLVNLYKMEAAVAQYQIEKGDEGATIRYRVNFPLSGHYLQIKDFITTALFKIPCLSLDSIELRRESATEDELEADVSFSLYFFVERQM